MFGLSDEVSWCLWRIMFQADVRKTVGVDPHERFLKWLGVHKRMLAEAAAYRELAS